MKRIIFFSLCLFLFSSEQLIAQNQSANQKNNIKSKSSVNKASTTKSQNTLGTTQKNTDSSPITTQNTDKPSTSKGCSTCPGFEGIILSTNAKGNFNFDSIVNTYFGKTEIENIGGIWKYQNTILINKNGNLVKILRAYYNDIDQELFGDKTTKESMSSSTQNDEAFFDPAQKIKKENERTGRETFDPTDHLIVFDPNVDYLFFDKDGEENDNYVIRKRKPDNSIVQLTIDDIRFKFSQNPKTKKYNFTLYAKDTQISKEFTLVELTADAFVLADYSFKEIHFFSRTGIHK